jgi:hypothetical protein
MAAVQGAKQGKMFQSAACTPIGFHSTNCISIQSQAARNNREFPGSILNSVPIAKRCQPDQLLQAAAAGDQEFGKLPAAGSPNRPATNRQPP